MLASEYGNINAIEALCKNGAKLDMKDNSGNTALILAVMQSKNSAPEKQEPIAKTLIEYGANKNHVNNESKDAKVIALYIQPNKKRFHAQVLTSIIPPSFKTNIFRVTPRRYNLK